MTIDLTTIIGATCVTTCPDGTFFATRTDSTEAT